MAGEERHAPPRRFCVPPGRISGSGLCSAAAFDIIGTVTADIGTACVSRRVKMRAVGMGAKTKWYFWPNAAVREFVGLLTEHRLKQGLILGGMVVFYVALTLTVYR